MWRIIVLKTQIYSRGFTTSSVVFDCGFSFRDQANVRVSNQRFILPMKQPAENPVQTWRQLWRVLEKSDMQRSSIHFYSDRYITRAGAVEADQSLNCHRPSGTGESRSKFSVLFFVLLSSFMCGAWPLSEQNGFWSVIFQFS